MIPSKSLYFKCISHTTIKLFLNSSIQSDDNRIKIDGYNVIRSDYASESKKGGVFTVINLS